MTRPARATTTAPAPAEKPRRGHPPKLLAAPAPAPVAVAQPAEVAVTVGREQRKIIDEYGELDRKVQLLAPDLARHALLKIAIKRWFDAFPPDADGIVEGAVYRLHVSARERERYVKSMQELVRVIGIARFLEIARVPVGVIEDMVGKTRAAGLIGEARTGSRRIKAVPKRPAGAKA